MSVKIRWNVLFMFMLYCCVFVSGDILDLREGGVYDQIGDVARKAVKRTVDADLSHDDSAPNQPVSFIYVYSP